MFNQKNRTSQQNQQQSQSTINNYTGGMSQINWITQKAFSAVDGRSSNSQCLTLNNSDLKSMNDNGITNTFKKSRTKQYEESPVKNLGFQAQPQMQNQQQMIQFQNVPQQQQVNQAMIGNQMAINNPQKNNQFTQGNIPQPQMQQSNVQVPYQQGFGQVNQNQSVICPISSNNVSQQMISQQLSTQNQQSQQVNQFEWERIQNIQDQLNEIQQRQNSKLGELQDQNNRILALMREQQEQQFLGKQMNDKAIKSIDKLEEKFDILTRDREQSINGNQDNQILQQRILNVEQGLQAFVRDNQIFQNQILTILNNDKEERALLRKTQLEQERKKK
ncbi:hypothetical protein pb186bvf_017688 [Paramecium bursaria]